MKRNRLKTLLREVTRERDLKIRANKRPWLNLVRLCTCPRRLEGVTCHRRHTSYSVQESRKLVALETGIIGGVELACSILCAFIEISQRNHPLPDLIWVLGFGLLFCLAWFVSSLSWFHFNYGSNWTNHATALASERARLRAIALGPLLTAELKRQIKAARQRLLEGEAGLSVWQKRVADRLGSLPTTEIATVPLLGKDRPYQELASVTVVQPAADQADLFQIASTYHELGFRIAETIAAYSALAEILGQSIDQRDGLTLHKGATSFDPRPAMATIDREVNEKLDALFAELATLQGLVSTLNGQAENALSVSAVKAVSKSIAGVRIVYDDSNERAEVAVSGTIPARQERKT